MNNILEQVKEVGIKERLSLEKHKAKEKAVGLNIQEHISAIHRRKEKASWTTHSIRGTQE